MNLSGRCVLVTRPAAQALALCSLIERAGGKPLSLPMLEIAPASSPPALRQALAQAAHCHIVIFTSVNALEQALLAGGARWPEKVFCVGAATAGAVRRAGLPPPFAPAEDYSSEGLLALPELRQLRGQRVLLVTGAGGRELLVETLQARGAEVIRADAYRRVPTMHAETTVRAALERADSGVVTSGETLERLIDVTPADLRTHLQLLPLVVPSLRVLQMARARGFTAAIGVPQPMSDAGMVRALAELKLSA
ncbi:MAG: uroporphyrinogen-III synthase [Nevskiales bacterium]